MTAVAMEICDTQAVKLGCHRGSGHDVGRAPAAERVRYFPLFFQDTSDLPAGQAHNFFGDNVVAADIGQARHAVSRRSKRRLDSFGRS